MDVRLIGYFRTRSPLSHIGESIGTTSYLVQEPVEQPDGRIEEIFVYSGNAWRGQLRDLAATYLLDKLGQPRIQNDAFHLLFGGGKIGGEQAINLAQARMVRKLLPSIAVWGGGVGNQILPGKSMFRNSYPVCREAIPVLEHIMYEDDNVFDVDFRVIRDDIPLPALMKRYDNIDNFSYRSMTMEKSFTRTDDAKNERLAEQYLPVSTTATEQTALGMGETKPKPAKAKGEVSDQMRMTSELLISGVVLETGIDLVDVTEIEFGSLVSALYQFSRHPYIGGQANRGHGLVDLLYAIENQDTREIAPLLGVLRGRYCSWPIADAAKLAYDQHCQQLYDAMISNNSAEIVKMLGVADGAVAGYRPFATWVCGRRPVVTGTGRDAGASSSTGSIGRRGVRAGHVRRNRTGRSRFAAGSGSGRSDLVVGM